MNIYDIFCHTVTVFVSSTPGPGRVTYEWTRVASLPCRFSQPVPSVEIPAEGMNADRIDAVVYIGPALMQYLSHLPIRSTATNKGWTGTYELRTVPRWYCGFTDAVHHGACRVVKVMPE